MKNRAGGIILAFCLMLLAASGCGEPGTVAAPKAIDEIAEDLLECSEFKETFVLHSCEIIKRATETRTDTVYVAVHRSSEWVDQTCAYKMVYGYYNEGWILDVVEAYAEDTWETKPCRGASNETIERQIPAGAELLSSQVELESGTQTVSYQYVETHRFCKVTKTEELQFYFDTVFQKWLTSGAPHVLDVQEVWQLEGTWGGDTCSLSVAKFETPETGCGVLQVSVQDEIEPHPIKADVVQTGTFSEELYLASAEKLLGFKLDYCVRQGDVLEQGGTFQDEFPYVVDISPVELAPRYIASDGSLLGDSLQSNFAEDYEKARSKIFIGYDGLAILKHSYVAQSEQRVTVELERLPYQET